MIIGIDAYGDQEAMAFQTLTVVNRFYRMQLGGAIFDEVFADKETSGLLAFNEQDWSYLTVLKGGFKNSLEAGNLQNAGVPIEGLQIRKRRIDSLTWVDLILIPFNLQNSVYEFYDRICQATQVYEYMVVPVTSNVYGSSVTEQIECEFSDTFVIDRDTSYRLYCNLEYGDIQNVLPNTVVETFQKYPTVLYGQPDYHRGSVKALILTDNTVSTGVINNRQERLNREQMMSFFKNKKPKILKDGSGRYYLVAIVGNPTETPSNQLNQAISDISFEWVQIDDAKSLDKWEV